MVVVRLALTMIVMALTLMASGQKANKWAGFGAGNELAFGYVLDPFHFGDLETLSPDRLTLTSPSGAFTHIAAIGKTGNNKYYWEVAIVSGGNNFDIGVATTGYTAANTLGQFDANGWGYVVAAGLPQKVHNGTFVSYGAAYAVGDTVGFLLDRAGSTLECYKNGVSQGVMYNTGLSTGVVYAALSVYNGNACKYTVNFGGTAFSGVPANSHTIPGGGVAYNQP